MVMRLIPLQVDGYVLVAMICDLNSGMLNMENGKK